MDYRVMVVADEALPRDVPRVIVEKRGRPPTLVVTERVAANWRFIQNWEREYGAQAEEFRLRAV